MFNYLSHMGGCRSHPRQYRCIGVFRCRGVQVVSLAFSRCRRRNGINIRQGKLHPQEKIALNVLFALRCVCASCRVTCTLNGNRTINAISIDPRNTVDRLFVVFMLATSDDFLSLVITVEFFFKCRPSPIQLYYEPSVVVAAPN